MFEYIIKIDRKQSPFYASNNHTIQKYEFLKEGTFLSAKREASKQAKNILEVIHNLETPGLVHLDLNILIDENIWLAGQFISFNSKKERCCQTIDSRWYDTHKGVLQSFREKRFPELALTSKDLLTKFINLR